MFVYQLMVVGGSSKESLSEIERKFAILSLFYLCIPSAQQHLRILSTPSRVAPVVDGWMEQDAEHDDGIKMPSFAFNGEREFDGNWQKLCASLSDLRLYPHPHYYLLLSIPVQYPIHPPVPPSAPAIHISTMYANLITDDGIMTSFQYC